MAAQPVDTSKEAFVIVDGKVLRRHILNRIGLLSDSCTKLYERIAKEIPDVQSAAALIVSLQGATNLNEHALIIRALAQRAAELESEIRSLKTYGQCYSEGTSYQITVEHAAWLGF